MASSHPTANRLPRTFHTSFKPERQYITAMLRYASAGKVGRYEDIRDETGIPTGSGSGKVQSVLDYCRGMGLVVLGGEVRSAVKQPELTHFGRAVLLDDPHLKEPVTQWIAHFNLCGPLTGADAWYHTFMAGAQTLGTRFSRTQLETHLSLVYGQQRGGLIGPLVGMYEDDASLRKCGALSESDGTIVRRPAPIENEFGYAYGAWLLHLMEKHFDCKGQVSVTDLDNVAGWRTIPGWDIPALQKALSLMEGKDVIEVDRHMDPWLLRPKTSAAATWPRIFDDMI